MDLDGTVLAKGTFNNLAQLERVLATAEAAERRERGGAAVPEPRAARSRRSPRTVPVDGLAATARGAASSPGSAARCRRYRRRSSPRLSSPARPTAYHFCGHIYTTDSCPHPTGAAADRPRRLPAARRGRPPDRRPRAAGQPQRPAARPSDGRALRDPDGRPLPPAPRTQGLRGRRQPRVRLQDPDRRLLVSLLRRPRAQADGLLRVQRQADQRRRRARRLLLQGRKVFCVMYFQTNVPC